MRTLVPKKAMAELNSLLGTTDVDAIDFAKDESTLFFRIGERVLTSRQLTGQFPNFEAVLPRDNNKFVTVRTKIFPPPSSASPSSPTSVQAPSSCVWIRARSRFVVLGRDRRVRRSD